MLNSGLQRVFDFTKPDTIDMSLFQNEVLTNYISLVVLAHAFLPFFQQKKEESAIVLYVTSNYQSIILSIPASQPRSFFTNQSSSPLAAPPPS